MNGAREGVLPAVAAAFAVGSIFVAGALVLSIQFNNNNDGDNLESKTASIAASLPLTTAGLRPDTTGGSSSPSRPENEDTTACTTPFVKRPSSTLTRHDDGTVIVNTRAPVYVMKPGTTGKLCIKYTGLYGGQNYSGKVYPEIVSPTAGVAATDGAEKVTIAPHPDQIGSGNYYFADAADAIANKASFDVTYTIRAAPDSKGFYGVWPLGFCPGLPLAVGYDASEINYSSDFAWQSGTYYCPAGSMQAEIVGLSGIDVFYVTSPSKTNIGYEITGVHSNVTRMELPSRPVPAADVAPATTAAAENQNTTATTTTITTVTFAVRLKTYDYAISVVADARDFEIAHFGGNPQLEEIDRCSWVPTNSTAVELAGARSIYDDRLGHDSRHVKVDAGMPAKIPARTDDYTYTFRVALMDLPTGYYALQPAIFITDAQEPVDEYGVNTGNASITNAAGSAIANYFPVTIGDALPSPLLLPAAAEKEGKPPSTAPESLYGRC
jgi:hypothetical protein